MVAAAQERPNDIRAQHAYAVAAAFEPAPLPVDAPDDPDAEEVDELDSEDELLELESFDEPDESLLELLESLADFDDAEADDFAESRLSLR